MSENDLSGMTAASDASRDRPAAWIYWCPEAASPVEFGRLNASPDAGLRPHFHDEAQISIVLSGVRSFRVDGRTIVLSAGQWIVFPRGVAHTALPSQGPATTCLNAYLPGPSEALDSVATAVGDARVRAGPAGLHDLAAEIAGRLSDTPGTGVAQPAIEARRPKPVGVAAARAGMSREGFSRRFAQAYGMPPHAFGVMKQLNAARVLLRAGEDPAGVAARTGFADQSHMGRLFRGAFGTTPGRYRRLETLK